MDNLLEIEDLVVRRGTHFSLSPICLSLSSKSGIVGLFGQNGAGKTTLLRAIAGLIKYQQGMVRVAGGRAPVFLPDRPYIYDFLRVGETPQVLRTYFSDFSIDIADDIITDLGLDRRKRVSQLSKGMSEQLSLGMMLARRAHVYLFDEPLAAVDPATRDVVLSLIERHQPEGSTIVISTHLISGLECLFNECLVLHEGQLLLHERVDDLLADGSLEDAFKKVMANA